MDPRNRSLTRHKVSVVMPCYNCSPTIEEAIASVLGQTHTNFEIIIIDDGSTDEGINKLKRFRENVRVIRQENSGVAAARNRGVKHANGDLIAFLDADDIWLPKKLAVQVAKIIGEGYDMVHCPAVNFGKLGTWNPPETQRIKLHDRDYLEALFLENFIVTSSVLIKKSCIEKVGGFKPTLRSCEDWDLWIRVASSFRITGVDEPLVRYRIDSSGLSSSIDKIVADGLCVLEDNKNLLPKHGREKTFKAAVYKIYLNGCWRHLRAGNRLKAVKYALMAISINPLKRSGLHWLLRAILS